MEINELATNTLSAAGPCTACTRLPDLTPTCSDMMIFDGVPCLLGVRGLGIWDFIAHEVKAYLTLLVDLFAVLLFLASIQVIHDYRRRGGLPYPPGPRPKPIVGNLLDIPKDFSWIAYAQFSKTYGTFVSLSVFSERTF